MNITLPKKIANHSHTLVEYQGIFNSRLVEAGVVLAGGAAAWIAYKALEYPQLVDYLKDSAKVLTGIVTFGKLIAWVLPDVIISVRAIDQNLLLMFKILSIGNPETNGILFVVFALICLSIWGILHFACKWKALEREVAVCKTREFEREIAQKNGQIEKMYGQSQRFERESSAELEQRIEAIQKEITECKEEYHSNARSRFSGFLGGKVNVSYDLSHKR